MIDYRIQTFLVLYETMNYRPAAGRFLPRRQPPAASFSQKARIVRRLRHPAFFENRLFSSFSI